MNRCGCPTLVGAAVPAALIPEAAEPPATAIMPPAPSLPAPAVSVPVPAAPTRLGPSMPELPAVGAAALPAVPAPAAGMPDMGGSAPELDAPPDPAGDIAAATDP